MKKIIIGIICLTLISSLVFSSSQIFYAGMETGDLSEFSSTRTNATATIANTGTYQFGGTKGAISTVSSAINSRAYANKGITSSSYLHIKTRFCNQWDSSGTNPKTIFGCYKVSDGTNSRLTVRLKDGTPSNYNSNFTFNVAVKDSAAHTSITSLDIATPVVTDSIWFNLDVFISKGVSDGKISLWVNGVLLLSLDTLHTSGAMPDSISWGCVTGWGTGDVGTVCFDEIVMDTMSCGPPCGLVFVEGVQSIWTGMKNWFRGCL
jgi:hypothetical protein